LKKNKLLYLVNVDWFFISHRLQIALAAKQTDYGVIIVTKDTGKFSFLKEKGFAVSDINLTRSGINPIKEILVIAKVFFIYLFQKPDLVHHVALKSVLYGSIISYILKIPTVNALSGLGYLFTDNQRNGKIRKLVLFILKKVLNNNHSILILQNNDDAEYFIKNNLITKNKLKIIKGSGVNLEEFRFFKEPEDDFIKIVFPARLLIDKGIIEFIEAAKICKSKYVNIEFLLVGDLDTHNPTTIKKKTLDKAIAENFVTWSGFQNDMVKIYNNSHIVVLPSYREGLPKALIEACAVGRPIVTTDVPGCREVVKENYNGFLVPVKNYELLAKAIEKLILDKDLRIKMGKNARILAEENFSIDSVVEKTLKIYDEVLKL